MHDAHDAWERITRLLDDVAAGRDPRDHMDRSALERHLAETARRSCSPPPVPLGA